MLGNYGWFTINMVPPTPTLTPTNPNPDQVMIEPSGTRVAEVSLGKEYIDWQTSIRRLRRRFGQMHVLGELGCRSTRDCHSSKTSNIGCSRLMNQLTTNIISDDLVRNYWFRVRLVTAQRKKGTNASQCLPRCKAVVPVRLRTF